MIPEVADIQVWPRTGASPLLTCYLSLDNKLCKQLDLLTLREHQDRVNPRSPCYENLAESTRLKYEESRFNLLGTLFLRQSPLLAMY